MLREMQREFNFAWKETALRSLIVVAFFLSAISLLAGALTINDQEDLALRLNTEIKSEQLQILKGKTDPGDIAYSLFHLTFDPPSELAFVAVGQRNELTWLHRVRLLALEGQIHETSDANPEILTLGHLDFSFFLSVLLPLLVIGLLFDIEAKEHRDRRHQLICSASRFGNRIFLIRAMVRSLLLAAAVTVPFIIAAINSNITLIQASSVIGLTLFQIVVWLALSQFITRRMREAATAGLSLISIWLVLTLLIPIIGKIFVEYRVPVPNGGSILLTQREAVNDAWDLPKTATMKPFTEAYPEWREYGDVRKPFEWKWYYAFQEMGDRAAKPIAQALYKGMRDRHEAMAWIALLSPSLLIERRLTALAGTDVLQHLRYIQCSRRFHAEMRHFYYPFLFHEKAMSESNLAEIPEFKPCAL